MKLAIKAALILGLLLPAFGQMTATYAGGAQSCTSPCTPVNGSVNSFSSSPSYNQPAGDCIWAVYTEGPENSGATGTVSDTAGDSFSLVTNSFVVDGTNAQSYVAFNSHGNASNVVTVTFPGSDVSGPWYSLAYYDISGPCNYVDVNVTTNQGTGLSSISETISTATANEVILTTGYNQFYASSPYSYITAITAPSGFTAGPLLAEDAESAYEVVSSRQSGLTVTWSAVSPYITNIIVNSLGYRSSAPNRVEYY